jgi:hypothetical protein
MWVEEAFSMRNERGQSDQEPEDVRVEPNPESIGARADGRPPEEASSDNPTVQAKAILEDSEERMEEGAKDSKPSR